MVALPLIERVADPGPAPLPEPVASEFADALADAIDRLPAQPVIAVRALRLMTDGTGSAAELGQLIELDPSLAARVMRLANAPHYGISGRVTSPARAVVMLGFSTVQGIAAAASASLLGDRADASGPWFHSIGVAAGCSVIARRLRLPVGPALTVGLLHDIGASLASEVAPDAAAAVERDVAAGVRRHDAEVRRFGLTHAEMGARALEAWRFPSSVVDAVAAHHTAQDRRVGTLGRVLVAAEALVERVEPGWGDGDGGNVDAVLDQLGLTAEAPSIVSAIGAEIDRLATLLEAG